MSLYPHHVVAMGYNTVPDGRDLTGASVDWNPPNQKKYSKYVCLSTDNGFTIALPYVTLETLAGSYIQWNLRIMDRSGMSILSIV